MSYISEKYGIQPGTVVRMIQDGIIDYKIERYYQFWEFYNAVIIDRNPHEARSEAMLHFKLCQRSFYNWIHRSRELFCNTNGKDYN